MFIVVGWHPNAQFISWFRKNCRFRNYDANAIFRFISQTFSSKHSKMCESSFKNPHMISWMSDSSDWRISFIDSWLIPAKFSMSLDFILQTFSAHLTEIIQDSDVMWFTYPETIRMLPLHYIWFNSRKKEI